MNGPRRVRPEILDTLPGDSPDARASRRDLRLINWTLGTRSWFETKLRPRYRAREHALEVGAGTGELGRALHSFIPDLAGLDLCNRPGDWPETARWFQTDILGFPDLARFPLVFGSLFSHHFDTAQLEQIGTKLGRHARVIVANEPLRARRIARGFSLLCPLIRAHPVTRHDGRISIAAGFERDELPLLLRLDPSSWKWQVRETWLGAYRMVAEKQP